MKNTFWAHILSQDNLFVHILSVMCGKLSPRTNILSMGLNVKCGKFGKFGCLLNLRCFTVTVSHSAYCACKPLVHSLHVAAQKPQSRLYSNPSVHSHTIFCIVTP